MGRTKGSKNDVTRFVSIKKLIAFNHNNLDALVPVPKQYAEVIFQLLGAEEFTGITIKEVYTSDKEDDAFSPQYTFNKLEDDED